MSNEKLEICEEKNADVLTEEDELLQIIIGVDRLTTRHSFCQMCRIGGLLVSAEKIVDHGQFAQWIRNNFEFSYATAKRFMRFYKNGGYDGVYC